MKLHDYRLQPTTGLKPQLQIFFWKCSEGNRCSKIQKNLCKTVSSSPTLTACSLEFPASTKQTPRKMFTGNMLRQDLQWSNFIQVTRLLSRILTLIKKITPCIFQGMFGKTSVLKISEDCQKNVFGKVLFKQFELSNLSSIYNYIEN